MVVIRIDKYNKKRLENRKFRHDESWNDVMTRLLDESKIYKVEDVLIEVKGDGTTVTAGSPVREKTIQD